VNEDVPIGDGESAMGHMCVGDADEAHGLISIQLNEFIINECQDAQIHLATGCSLE
jgi:hypothetical protein